MEFLSKNKYINIIGIIFLLIIVWGIFQDKNDTDKIDTELKQLIIAINSTGQETQQVILDNQACFIDESLEKGTSAECVIVLQNIKKTFKTTDKENLDKLEIYYQTNQSRLDDDTKKMINDSLRLYKSSTYFDLMNAYDEFFITYIEWHKYFRDYIGIKGIDNITEKEIMMSTTLAENVLAVDENIVLKVNDFTDFLQENFDKEFINTLLTYK